MKKYLSEGLLIVFSVLFALFINKLYEDYKINRQKHIAIEGIQKELQFNAKILSRWREVHIEIGERIHAIIIGQNDSTKQQLAQGNYLDLGLLTDQENLFDAFPTSTAWETTKSTQIIAEFDFETSQKLTHVYTLQDKLTNETVNRILDLLFERETHNMENIDDTLLQFQIRLQEIVGQENLIIQLYTEALEELN